MWHAAKISLRNFCLTGHIHISIKMPKLQMAAVQETWRAADAVCFDVDSTVIQEEGIDQLANYLGVGERVQQLTKQAMGGNMTFKEALKLRLNIISPSQQQVNQFVSNRPSTLTTGIEELVTILQSRGVHVYLVSGGFHQLIQPVAKQLNISYEDVFANRLMFDRKGEYSHFDENQLTCDSGGKAKVMRLLKDTHKYHTLVHIGDGMTDWEACPPADAFIGFGGNVVRDSVKEKAKWFVHNFQELIDSLDPIAVNGSTQ